MKSFSCFALTCTLAAGALLALALCGPAFAGGGLSCPPRQCGLNGPSLHGLVLPEAPMHAASP